MVFARASRIAILLCVILCAALSPVPLQLNPNSTEFTDIKSVTHYPLKREVVIELKDQRRCQNPTFITRMSGMSLYLLDLEWHPTPKVFGLKTLHKFFQPQPNVYIFSYPPLEDSGTYYLEVIVLYCGSFDPNSYKDLCVESPHDKANVVTLPYNFAFATDALVPPAKPQRPRWVWGNTAQAPALLPTRYQTRNCEDGSYCGAQGSDLAQHRQYKWVGQPDWRSPLAAVLTKGEISATTAMYTKSISVCFVGSSHEREMLDHGRKIAGAGNVHFKHILSTHPEHFHLADLQKHGCHYTIIGYGQWPVSYIEETPYTQEHFTRVLTEVFEQIAPHNSTQEGRIFVQSVNYNALSAVISCCAPIDHRTPSVIDMMNTVMRTLSNKYNVGFIDHHHIMGPLWDSAEDWNHPRGAVFTAEVEHVLYSIFTASILHNYYPVLGS